MIGKPDSLAAPIGSPLAAAGRFRVGPSLPTAILAIRRTGLDQPVEKDDHAPDAEDRPAPAALQRTDAAEYVGTSALIVRSLRR